MIVLDHLSRSSLEGTARVWTEVQEGLLPLPLIDSGPHPTKLRHLTRKVRNRMENRAAVDRELNLAIKEINGLGKGLVGCGKGPPPPDAACTSFCSTEPPAGKKPPLGLREDLVRLRSSEESIPGADSSAFSALAKKVVQD